MRRIIEFFPPNEQRQVRLVLAGVLISLLWSAGKVSVPRVVQLAIDRGIEGDDSAVSLGPSLVRPAASGARELLGALPAYLGFFCCSEAMWSSSVTRLVWRRSSSPSRRLSSSAAASAARMFFSGVL